MVDFATYGRLVAGVALLLGNGFFVTTEFALTRVRQFPEDEFVDTGSRGLARAWEMTERLEIFLSGCQLGITICSVGLGVVAEPALAAVVDPLIVAAGATPPPSGHTALATGVALAVINLLHLSVGEQAPTYLGIERTKFVAKYGAPVLYWWTTVLSPIIRLADWTAKALLGLFGVQISRSWTEAEGDGAADSRGAALTRMGEIMARFDVPEDRRSEVLNALALDRIEVADVMVPREEVVALSTRDPPEESLTTIREQPHTRFVLVDDGLDDPVGVVSVPALVRSWAALGGTESLRAVASALVTVPPDLPVSDLIDRLQEAGQTVALVVEDGRTTGLVTATDGFEAVAGELTDPLDEEGTAHERGGTATN